MPIIDGSTLLTLAVLACGSGIFLHLVAKEKHRREKHIELRLMKKVKELEKAERKKREEQEEQYQQEASESDETSMQLDDDEGDGHEEGD